LSNAAVDPARPADPSLATETQLCVLLLALLASISLGYRRAAAEPATAAPPEEGSSSRMLTVEARLVDTGLSVPHCGVLQFVAVMRYEVLDVVEGRYLEREIFVAHPCPESGLRDGRGHLASFHAGDLHWLRLQRAGSTAAFSDRFARPDLPRYEATQALLLRP